MSERSITFGKNAWDIDKKIASMPDLEEIIVEEENPDYLSKGGLLFKKDGKKMIACPKGRTECSVPEGTTFIRNLQGCSKLKTLYIPKTVTDIGRQFFAGCDALEEVTVEGAKLKFKAEHFDNKGIPKGLFPKILTLAKNLSPDAVSAFILDNNAWKQLSAETMVKLYLQFCSKATETRFDPVIRQTRADAFAELMVRSLQEKSSGKEKENAAGFLLRYGAQLKEENRADLDACTAGRPVRVPKEKPDELEVMTERIAEMLPAEQKAMEGMISDALNAKSLEKRLKTYFGLTFRDLPLVNDAQGRETGNFVFAWLLTAHGGMDDHQWRDDAAYTEPGVRPEAAEVVALLDPDSFHKALMELADEYLVKYQTKKVKYISQPFCRYADEKMMAELTRRAPRWSTSTSGNAAPPLFQLRCAALFSNTRAAMLFADRFGDLNSYARLRGMSGEEFRDRYLSDVGLDEDGGKAYDLGNQTVTARLQSDLSFLVELPDGKTAKSLPKKGADPAKYETANADFSEMRKSVKSILKNRGKILFNDFLSGYSRGAEEWQQVYLKNPLLRAAASMVVWSQGSRTFTLLEGKPVSSEGNPYMITGKPVKVAHPLEMDPEDTRRWQKYFAAHGLKQPFEQVWEPVRNVDLIRPERYEGCEMPITRMSGKDRHGIHAYGMNPYSEDYGFDLDDCDLEYSVTGGRLGYYWADSDATFKLGRFSFTKYTRKVNHIVTILDKMTLLGRVRNDDPGVMDMIDTFTLAQIMDFISEAQDAGASTLLAQMLDYKNSHFADYDPMDEFTLEW